MTQSVVRFLVCASIVISFSVEIASAIRCIHPWVKTPPADDNNATTPFIPEEDLVAFFDSGLKQPFNSSSIDIKRILFYESTKSYCLYFKLVDGALSDTVLSNDIHHAILRSYDVVFDFIAFHKSVSKICEKPNAREAGIGFMKQIQYKVKPKPSIASRRSKYVKVKWFCCQSCNKTIDDIEMAMLTLLLPVNYRPKKANFSPSPVIKNGTKLRTRAISPCYDIYGELTEIATPNYDIPVCPIYAYFDAGSPHYTFNHGESRSPENLAKMSDFCLSNPEQTENLCVWDYLQNLSNYSFSNSPVELKCCCYKDLPTCSYELSIRRQSTLCFVINSTAVLAQLLQASDRFAMDAFDTSSSECFVRIQFPTKQSGLLFYLPMAHIVAGHYESIKPAASKSDERCRKEMNELGLSMHCIIEFVTRKDRHLCPFVKITNIFADVPEELVHSCCCKGTHLCNLAYARELLMGIYRGDNFRLIANSARIVNKHANLTDTYQKVVAQYCPVNALEFWYTPKGCVQYHLPTYENVFLIENYHFQVEDYVEFGKFSDCSLLQVKMREEFSGKEACQKKGLLKEYEAFQGKPVFLLRCRCGKGTQGTCSYNATSRELKSIDTRSPCNIREHVSETELVDIESANVTFTEPSYCSVSFSIENGSMIKSFKGYNQTWLLRQFDSEVPQAEKSEYLQQITEQRCRIKMNTGRSGHKSFEAACFCMSKEHEPCNTIVLMNKAINLLYGQLRVGESITDESFQCPSTRDELKNTEACYQPGCFIMVERNQTEAGDVEVERSGCVHRHENDLEDLYARRLCLLTKLENDCSIVFPPEGREPHVLCCCAGRECRTSEFHSKQRIKIKTFEDYMNGDEEE